MSQTLADPGSNDAAHSNWQLAAPTSALSADGARAHVTIDDRHVTHVTKMCLLTSMRRMVTNRLFSF